MLDTADEAILRLLEKDARLSFDHLAEQIGLSKTPTWERVRKLEQRKIITGYHAAIDPARLGLELHAFVQVTITPAHHAEFEAAVIRHPSILSCYTTAGQGDYLLHVLVADIEALDAFLRDELSCMPAVERMVTTVGMKTIKQRTSIVDCACRDSRGAPRKPRIK
jgi:Lrp/AsnC family leucine-responsive transcriptional regulator